MSILISQGPHCCSDWPAEDEARWSVCVPLQALFMA